MEHVAIMRKSWGLLPRILSGEKTIESRWYSSRRPPFGKIKAGETIYFKDSGEPITISAEVEKVLEFSGLNPKKAEEILCRYGSMDGLRREEIPEFLERFKGKKYCTLIFLKNPHKIPPFEISKKGFGSMAAWICAPKIQELRRQ